MWIDDNNVWQVDSQRPTGYRVLELGEKTQQLYDIFGTHQYFRAYRDDFLDVARKHYRDIIYPTVTVDDWDKDYREIKMLAMDYQPKKDYKYTPEELNEIEKNNKFFRSNSKRTCLFRFKRRWFKIYFDKQIKTKK